MASYGLTNGHGHNGTHDDASNVASSSNNHHLVNGHIEDSYVDTDEPTIQAERAHNERIAAHVFTTGFQRGEYSDVVVQFGHTPFRLHRLIISRSPYLAHLMNQNPYTDLYIPLEQLPDITLEAATIAISYLYSHSAVNLVNAGNARSTLAVASLFGGMEELCERAFEICKEWISEDTISDWLAWVDALHIAPPVSPGVSTPSTPISASPIPNQTLALTTIYGHYAPLLRDVIFTFLLETLPQTLRAKVEESGRPASDVQKTLLDIFSRVSFEIFKSSMESPKFQIGSDQDRFLFTKTAIARRKEVSGPQDAEETVVLAVGDGRSSVHVTKKLRRKGRPLWKVTK